MSEVKTQERIFEISYIDKVMRICRQFSENRKQMPLESVPELTLDTFDRKSPTDVKATDSGKIMELLW